MTSRATFGDLSRLAASQLDQAISPPAPVSKRNLAKARAVSGWVPARRPGGQPPARPAAHPSRAGSGLDAAVTSLTAGRDLLHTHFAIGRDGARAARSGWAPVITSAPITRALLLELGQWARTAARHGAGLASSGPPILRGTEEQRRMLNAACQWLWILDATVAEAHRHDPVSPPTPNCCTPSR